jgi:hypothetical protein
VTRGLCSWLAPLQAFALVTSPRLGLRQDTYVVKTINSLTFAITDAKAMEFIHMKVHP